MFLCFFVKQNIAKEMRISDWSSDVCSSDLPSTLCVWSKVAQTTGFFGSSHRCNVCSSQLNVLTVFNLSHHPGSRYIYKIALHLLAQPSNGVVIIKCTK